METNWSMEQTKKLFALVKQTSDKGKGLISAFDQMSTECGRSVNSVRNYYYSQLKMFELVPSLASDLGITLIKSCRADFELFSEKEIEALVENILIEKAKGKSVRATISEMSRGDEKLALRLQNKYRSMISNHKSRVENIMKDLSKREVHYFNPYTKQVVTKQEGMTNYQRLTEYISSLDEAEIDSFFVLIKKLFA